MVSLNMPRFFFDLFFEHYVVLDPGGLFFEYPTNATAAADEMARHLLVSRAELRNSGSWIRVRDERRKEVYRSSIAPADEVAEASSQAQSAFSKNEEALGPRGSRQS
jgi:hypothetical protein